MTSSVAINGLAKTCFSGRATGKLLCKKNKVLSGIRTPNQNPDNECVDHTLMLMRYYLASFPGLQASMPSFRRLQSEKYCKRRKLGVEAWERGSYYNVHVHVLPPAIWIALSEMQYMTHQSDTYPNLILSSPSSRKRPSNLAGRSFRCAVDGR